MDNKGIEIELEHLVKDLITSNTFKVLEINSKKSTVLIGKGSKSPFNTHSKYLEVWSDKKIK